MPHPVRVPQADPWARARAGTVGVSVRPSLFTLYEIDGFFTNVSVVPTVSETDSSDITGKFGLVLDGEWWVTDRLSLVAGADYRVYDVDDLSPLKPDPGGTQPPDILVETVDSLQYHLGARWAFDPFDQLPLLPWAPDGGFRPYALARVAWLPSVDFDFETNLAPFGLSNIAVQSEGEPFWLGALAVGLQWPWRERLLAEVGVYYEWPLTSLDATLPLDLGVASVDVEAELEPAGVTGFVGLTWLF